MKVFISGSRMPNATGCIVKWNRDKIPEEIKVELDGIINRGDEILIGHAYGADSFTQSYLQKSNYQKVTIYYSGKHPRFNHGQWSQKYIKTVGEQGYIYYTEEDFAMAEDADYGIIIWNGESLGSFVNMLNLIFHGKMCRLFLIKENRWIDICSTEDIAPFAGEPGQIGLDDIRKVLEVCGFSEEMKEYLLTENAVDDNRLLDIICGAPVFLSTKFHLIGELLKKRNVLYELFDCFRRCYECRATSDEYKNRIRALISAPSEDSIWHPLLQAKNDIDEAIAFLYPDEGFYDESYRINLFAEWYDEDVLMEKSSFCSMFRTPDEAFQYVFNEEIDDETGEHSDEAAISWWHRMEIWENVDDKMSKSMAHVYDFYIYNGDVCWFTKMKPLRQENGNIYYLPVNRRHSGGRVDLNLQTPFKTGNLVWMDCQPFGSPFKAMILEAYSQYDCCFPNIVFQMPFTDKWVCTPLKHRRFFYDPETGFYDPMLSPLYRLRKVRPEELTEEDKRLINLKRKVNGNEAFAKEIWNRWGCEPLSYESVLTVFEEAAKLCRIKQDRQN